MSSLTSSFCKTRPPVAEPLTTPSPLADVFGAAGAGAGAGAGVGAGVGAGAGSAA